MFYLKNSIKNIKRNKSKYLIVGILITLISFVSVISIVINSSANQKIDEQAQIYGSEIKIAQDPEYFREQMKSGNTETDMQGLTYAEYQEIAKSDYVDYTEYLQVSQIYSEAITQVESEQPQGFKNGGNKMGQPETNEAVSDMASFNITGTDDVENSSEFTDGNNILIEGTYPQSDNEILISQSLLDENNLKIGDTTEFFASDGETKVEMKIVGTFENMNETENMMANSSNSIYTTFSTMSQIDDEKTRLEVTYHLNNYQDADAFEAEINKMGIPESMYVDKNETALNQVVGPLKNMKTLLTSFMFIVIILGGATLVFVNLLILKERKYEIGVLRALGQSKAQVISSIITEIAIVAAIAMIIGTVIGLLSSQVVADVLLNSISSAATSTTAQPGPEMGRKMMETLPTISDLSTYVDFTALIKVIVINIILILVSAFTAISFIVKYQPSQILREGK